MQAASAAGVTVTAGGGQVAVNGVSVSGAAVVLTLAAPVAAGAAVSLQYDGASGVVLDLAGNAIGITSVAVQNLTAAPEPEAPPPPPPITGSAGDDVVFLVGGGATFSAGDGADVVTGGGGDDWIHGNMGEDTIRGGLGNDIVHGGQGRDALYGDDGDDVLFGDRGDDFVHGGRGDDVIDGGDGADILAGGQGNDVLRGGDGGDVLAGDRGDDTLVGGAGADLFRFAPGGGADIITDFSVAEGDVLLVEGPYTLFQRGADVVVDLGDGGTVTVQNAQLAWLPAGWILS
ncbi:hypothetical protein LRS10_08910 [Phenylobacterium sp. J426]|uniref:calcium-binding protein n=1 Tax=Phenylobacterium sp. J426 TaxID=2898439 RepID=UPI002150A62F|nr:calcium-binding protein [Phenylobacterium sp. J426]MCR5874275.1 hypothetical protein [Phenylobacterium sp. J426]